MNKAFVKEIDPDPRCPGPAGCGGRGEEVSTETLEAQLSEEEARRFSSSAFFCPSPSCPIVYFDSMGLAVPVERLARPVYPKDPDGPVCSCFGVTAEQIREDAAAGRKDQIRDLLRRTAGPDAHCVRLAPNGRSCETQVRRLFLQSLAGGPEGSPSPSRQSQP